MRWLKRYLCRGISEAAAVHGDQRSLRIATSTRA